MSQAIIILGELLSRGSNLGMTYSSDEIEAVLAAILEVKVKLHSSISRNFNRINWRIPRTICFIFLNITFFRWKQL